MMNKEEFAKRIRQLLDEYCGDDARWKEVIIRHEENGVHIILVVGRTEASTADEHPLGDE